MLFQPEHIPLIRDGVKTETRRDWSPNYNRPKIGSVQMAKTDFFETDQECDCYIRILDVYQEPLGELDQESADAEGGYTIAEYRHAWTEINGDEWDPEQVVDVVEFEYVGRSRPD